MTTPPPLRGIGGGLFGAMLGNPMEEQASRQSQELARQQMGTSFLGAEVGSTGWINATGSIGVDEATGFNDYNRRFTFYRVNEKVSIAECEIVNKLEPLDELRIKVAKWLS